MNNIIRKHFSFNIDSPILLNDLEDEILEKIKAYLCGAKVVFLQFYISEYKFFINSFMIKMENYILNDCDIIMENVIDTEMLNNKIVIRLDILYLRKL